MSTSLEVPEDDAISLTLARFKPADLLEVIRGLKQVIAQHPEQAKAMLQANPDLTYAVLQAELLMGLVDETVVAEAMKASHVSGAQSDVQASADPAPQPASPSESRDATGTPEAAPQAAAPRRDPFAGLDPQQAEMIRSVIAIPDEQLQQLPPDQREQVLNLKKTYGS